MILEHPTNLPNFAKLRVKDDFSVYFSYQTPIAVLVDGMPYVTVNEWKQTTGRHINDVKRAHPNFITVEHATILSIIQKEMGN